jgi:CHASE3 domain sensor protein
MKTIISAIAAAGVLFGASAIASERYSEETALCASAIATESGRSLDDASVTLKKMRDRAVKRLTVQVKYSDGASSTGECFIRKGEIESVSVEA